MATATKETKRADRATRKDAQIKEVLARFRRRRQFADAGPALLEALEGLLEFAEQYGPSDRASALDWSGYFEAAHEAIALVEGGDTR